MTDFDDPEKSGHNAFLCFDSAESLSTVLSLFSGAKTFVFSATNQKWMTKSPSDWLMTSVVSERTSWKALGEKECLVIRSNSAFQIQMLLKVGKTSSEILIQVFDFPAKSKRNISTQIWLSSEILSFITAPRTKKCYLRKTK